MRRTELAWGRSGKKCGKWRSRDVKEGLCVCRHGEQREESTHWERERVRNFGWWGFYNTDLYYSIATYFHQCNVNFISNDQWSCAWDLGETKRQGCVPSLDRADQKEKWVQGRRVQVSQSKTAVGKPGARGHRKRINLRISATSRGEGIPLPRGQQEGASVNLIWISKRKVTSSQLG